MDSSTPQQTELEGDVQLEVLKCGMDAQFVILAASRPAPAPNSAGAIERMTSGRNRRASDRTAGAEEAA